SGSCSAASLLPPLCPCSLTGPGLSRPHSPPRRWPGSPLRSAGRLRRDGGPDVQWGAAALTRANGRTHVSPVRLFVLLMSAILGEMSASEDPTEGALRVRQSPTAIFDGDLSSRISRKFS